MMFWASDTEIECLDCQGQGQIDIYKDDRGPSHWPDCKSCNGRGLRAPTADELDNAEEAAYQRQFEGEPPLSQRERDELQRRRDAQWGVS